METDERKVTQISVEDLTVILKDHQYFRVRYFAIFIIKARMAMR